jgi:hypothetical protein
MDSSLNANGRANKDSDSQPENEATFRTGPLVNLASLVGSFDCDPVVIFGAVDFKPEDFCDANRRIPYIKASHLFAHCVEATRCEHLGLLLGQMAEPSLLGLAGFLLRTASTVEQALQALVANLDLHDEGGASTLRIGPSHTSLEFALQIPGVAAPQQIYDLAATIMHKVMLGLCGPDWVATEVRLPRREPDDITPYQQHFRAKLLFNSPSCSVVVLIGFAR